MDNVTNRNNTIFSTPGQKTLHFFLLNPDLEFSDTDIYNAKIGVGRSAINSALRELAGMGWIERKKKGKTAVNCLRQTEPIIIYLKVLSSVLAVDKFVEKCKAHAYKIVLFGSRAEGTYNRDSDFDVIVVTDKPEIIHRILSEEGIFVQLIVKSPEEMMRLHEKEPVLARAISKGIILWEKV